MHCRFDKSDSLLCSAIIKCSANLTWNLGLQPQVILGSLGCACAEGAVSEAVGSHPCRIDRLQSHGHDRARGLRLWLFRLACGVPGPSATAGRMQGRCDLTSYLLAYKSGPLIPPRTLIVAHRAGRLLRGSGDGCGSGEQGAALPVSQSGGGHRAGTQLRPPL